MSILLEKGKTVAIWYLNLPKDFKYDETHVGGDYLCALFYEEKEGKRELVIKYRFRYYTIHKEQNNPFEDDDIKKWYSARGLKGVTENYTFLATQHVVKTMAERAGGTEVFEFDFREDFDATFKKFQDAPFAYMRSLSKEEYEKAYGTISK